MTKIPCTNRILLLHGKMIYCSCDIVREVREMLERVNQRYCPKKNEGDNLFYRLRDLSRQERFEGHFPRSSRRILGDLGEL